MKPTFKVLGLMLVLALAFAADKTIAQSFPKQQVVAVPAAFPQRFEKRKVQLESTCEVGSCFNDTCTEFDNRITVIQQLSGQFYGIRIEPNT